MTGSRHLFFVLAACGASVASAADVGPALADLSLEELGNIEVTSVSKRPERLADAPASVFVITEDDIRRSGAASLPDVLRLAPNLTVARSNSIGYTITARGFNSSAGNKVLVLIDGRTVYSPLFSGVFWDAEDVMLEDVERIEVISGPGGTLWGTNAVNGVINIMTRAPRGTQGSLIAIGGGDADAVAAGRFGGELETGHYRAYGKYVDRDHTTLADGRAVNDRGSRGQVGFRAEWDTRAGQLGVQADAYDGDEDQPAPGMFNLNGISRLNPISISGANVLARWARRLDGGSDVALLAYYGRTERDVPGTLLYSLDVVDIQFQQSFAPGGAHTTTWGAEYRHGSDHIVNDDFIAFLPAETDRAWASLFAQDEIALREDVKLVVGARLEHNDYTGNEFLPSARLAWNVTDDHLVWAAASRTARAPSRIDRDFYFPATAPFLIQGGANFQSEVADVYEVGYRGQISPRVTASATAFRTQYDHLRTLEIAPSGTYAEFANEMDGTTSGVEMWATFEITGDWRLGAGYAALHKDLALKPGSDGLNGGVAAEGNDPDHGWQLRSTHDLFARWQLDAIVRQVASLPLPSVPRYLTADVRVGLTVRPGLEVSLTGRNLVGGSHAEFRDPATRAEFDREVFVKVVVARR